MRKGFRVAARLPTLYKDSRLLRQLETDMQNRADLCALIPNSRALLDFQEGQFVTVLQACIADTWTTVSILSGTRSANREHSEQLGRTEAAELGVPWFNGARLVAPHWCRCCGELSPTGRDCCTDDFPEPADIREWE